VDRTAFQNWLDRYLEAWRTNDAEAIGQLFSADATYLWNPYDEPTRGREEIVKGWTEDWEPPETWEARYEALAVDGDVGVAHGRTRYLAGSDSAGREYDNIFVCRFDGEGRCREFTEWFMEPRREAVEAA